MYHDICIHSSVNGPLGCYYVLDIVKSAAKNTGVHVSLSIMFFFQGTHPVVGLLCHMVVVSLVFKGISILFSIVIVSIYIPTNPASVFVNKVLLKHSYTHLITFCLRLFSYCSGRVR